MKVKVAKLKRIISAKDNRVKKAAQPKPVTRNLQQQASNLFFSHNKLTPPFSVLIDTNFINFSLQNKLNIEQAMMDCLYAKEKMGEKWRIALGLARQFERLPCCHKGTYADDCIIDRITVNRCYIVATCDKDLKKRIRKIPGVPIMYIAGRKFQVERMADAPIH